MPLSTLSLIRICLFAVLVLKPDVFHQVGQGGPLSIPLLNDRHPFDVMPGEGFVLQDSSLPLSNITLGFEKPGCPLLLPSMNLAFSPVSTMAPRVDKYFLPPTALMPNSPKPLLHYPSFFTPDECTPSNVYRILRSNRWRARWLARYGPNQPSHYHSAVHECMVVLSGSARVLFGVADLTEDITGGSSKTENAMEEGGLLLDAHVGDVFILPAGLAHKTHDPNPVSEFAWLSPGDGRAPSDEDMEAAMSTVQLSGFTMLGSYPQAGEDWDFAVGGESEGQYEKVWSVPVPERDPVQGGAEGGLCTHWD